MKKRERLFPPHTVKRILNEVIEPLKLQKKRGDKSIDIDDAIDIVLSVEEKYFGEE